MSLSSSIVMQWSSCTNLVFLVTAWRKGNCYFILKKYFSDRLTWNFLARIIILPNFVVLIDFRPFELFYHQKFLFKRISFTLDRINISKTYQSYPHRHDWAPKIYLL
jgi:hypothetical protein